MILSILAAALFAVALALAINAGGRQSRTSRIVAKSSSVSREGQAYASSSRNQQSSQLDGRLRANSGQALIESRAAEQLPDRQTAIVLAACGVAGLAAFLLLGGLIGVGAAIAIVVFGPKILSSFESRATRVRRESILRDSPLVAELLAACLQAGVSDQRALKSVIAALDGPIVQDLGMVLHALSLGTDPADAWNMLESGSPLGPIARAFIRSANSGAPLSTLLANVSTELRSKHAAAVESAARSVAVKSVAPLGVCFLPAFILLGVVPLVASLFSQVSPF